MSIGRKEDAFDHPDYLFELKVDGDRCLAYCDQVGTTLINKRGRHVLPYFPELAGIHTQVRQRCILDGELVVGAGRKEDFGHIRSRMSSSQPKIDREARLHPALFMAFDILYLKDREIVDLPLVERKALLQGNVAQGPLLDLSLSVVGRGKDLFDLVTGQGLEGVIAKHIQSRYLMGKRTREWVKCKRWDRDYFIICGYVPSEKANVVSLILAQYQGTSPRYVGQVVLGRQNPDFPVIQRLPSASPLVVPPFSADKVSKAIWVKPDLVCQVEFLCRTSTGGLRQPAYRGLASDILPREALFPEDGSV